MRDVRTIILAAVSRRDLCHVSENEGFRFCEKNLVFFLKPGCCGVPIPAVAFFSTKKATFYLKTRDNPDFGPLR